MERKDYLMTDTYDYYIQDGDFKVGVSDTAHKQILCLARKGHIRDYVRLGVGIHDFLNGIMNEDVSVRILETFKQDGYNVRGIILGDDTIYIP